MKKIGFLLVLITMLFASCREDDSYKGDEPDSRVGTIRLALTGRIGSVVGDSLTEYVKSLNLLLFRENNAGDYTLYRQVLLTKEELNALSSNNGAEEAGFTVFKEFTFDAVPLDNYRIVGIGNVQDSLGNALPEVSLQGAVAGNTLSQVRAVVRELDESPRLFWGITEVITAGTTESTPPVLRLFRKVSMFALTLKDIPNAVNRIGMEIWNTYGTFDAGGTFLSGSGIIVQASSPYTIQPGDSTTFTYVTLPTIANDSSSFNTTFYLQDGPKQLIGLPKYILHPNTITKVTATIDTDQPGNIWKVDVSSLISVNVEWNVDQEPPIEI